MSPKTAAGNIFAQFLGARFSRKMLVILPASFFFKISILQMSTSAVTQVVTGFSVAGLRVFFFCSFICCSFYDSCLTQRGPPMIEHVELDRILISLSPLHLFILFFIYFFY